MNMTGYQCDIAYNIALCYYKLKQLAPSLKHIADIIEKELENTPNWELVLTLKELRSRVLVTHKHLERLL